MHARRAVWVGLAGATMAFGLVVALLPAVAGDRLDGLDARAAAALTWNEGSVQQAFLAGVSAWHATRVVLAALALAAGALLARGDRAGVALLVATVLGGALLNHLLKHAVARPRPGVAQALSAVTDHGFPSGHVAHATLLYGVLATLVLQRAAPRPWHWAAVPAAALVVGLVGASRIALGAHRLSDVLAGVAVGLGWLALCLAAAAAWQRR